MTTLAPPLPVPVEAWQQLQPIVSRLDPTQLNWLSGFLAGLASSSSTLRSSLPPAPATAPALKATIIHASHTGNGKNIAQTLQAQLKAEGVDARLFSAADYPVRELKLERLLFAVVSTHGDGEPPESARDFFDYLASGRAPQLPELRYAVLALGDSSYPLFCAAGKFVDEKLRALGATALRDRIDADTDFSTLAENFRQNAVTVIRQSKPAIATALVEELNIITSTHSTPTYHREQPFSARLLANQRITARDAEKDVRHIEIDLAGSGLQYLPGDALGIWPRNDAGLVQRIVQISTADPNASVTRNGRSTPLLDALTNELEITQLSLPVLQRYSELTANTELAQIITSPELLASFLRENQLIDLLQHYGVPEDLSALWTSLRGLTPRLYSIASSTQEVGDEVHITVGVREYEKNEQLYRGAASGFLAGLHTSANLPVFIQANEHFRLPADPDRAVIMIGAGTGVAPYRAFLQERVASGARGKHWLLFGEQRRRATFLYQNEWLNYKKRGALQKLDVAFSRDQAEKIYVQDRIREQATDLYQWLEEGACVYVCGDARRLAPAVHEALKHVVQKQTGKSAEQAEDYWRTLTREHRYSRDVY